MEQVKETSVEEGAVEIAEISENDIGRVMREGRVKIVSLDPLLAVDLLNWCSNPKQFYSLPKCDPIPEDAFVVSVHDCPSRRSIEVIIGHSSFPRSIPGAMLERIDMFGAEYRIYRRCEPNKLVDESSILSLEWELRELKIRQMHVESLLSGLRLAKLRRESDAEALEYVQSGDSEPVAELSVCPCPDLPISPSLQ